MFLRWGRLAKEERLAEYFNPEDRESVICCIKRVLLNGEDYYSDKIKMANKYANERDWSNLSRNLLRALSNEFSLRIPCKTQISDENQIYKNNKWLELKECNVKAKITPQMISFTTN